MIWVMMILVGIDSMQQDLRKRDWLLQAKISHAFLNKKNAYMTFYWIFVFVGAFHNK